MIYKIRVILDTKEDVFRDIEVRDKQTLFTLYKGIMSAFSLKGERRRFRFQYFSILRRNRFMLPNC